MSNLGTAGTPTFPKNAAAVTPHATNRFLASVIYTTDGGNINAVTAGGDTVLFEAVPAGGVLPCECIGILVASTAATKIYRVW